MKSIPRIAENKLHQWMNKRKALVLIGARQVGKTTLLNQLFPSKTDVLWLNADETSVRERLKNADINSLKGVIGSYTKIIIDEIQRVANSGLLLKILVDNFKEVQFIATGSSALEISENLFEPLTGRHFLFHLYPFSMAELYKGKSEFEIEKELPFHLIYGSYPEICINRPDALFLLKNLSDQYLYKDVLLWKDIRKPELLDKLLKLLAFQIGSEVSVNELAMNLKVKSETVESYIDLLEKSFVIFRLPAYSTNERKEITKMSKIFFWDNGIRNAIIDNYNDLSLRNDIGQLWENFMISERMKMNAYLFPEAKSYFWRNYNQSEVDYVESKNGELFAYEFKWNSKKQANVSKAFTNAYPTAQTNVITHVSFAEFCQQNN